MKSIFSPQCQLAPRGDTMEGILSYCDNVNCNLAIMGTTALTKGGAGSMGSFAMTGLKALPYNFLIVKNSITVKPYGALTGPKESNPGDRTRERAPPP